MSSFWNNLYDRHKDRRYATIFLATILAFFGLVVPGVVFLLHFPPFHVSLRFVLPGLSLLIVALIGRAVRRAREQPENRPTYSPLSRDERHKARSKLKSSFRSPPAKAPDTNLKY